MASSDEQDTHGRDEESLPDVTPLLGDADADTAFVTDALAGLAFLRLDSYGSPAGPDVAPMPDWAWARMTTVLAAEQAGASPRRPSRLARWGGGLVAASVAVVAVGVGVTAFQDSGSGGAVVAGSSADAPAAADPAAVARSWVEMSTGRRTSYALVAALHGRQANARRIRSILAML